MRAIVNQPAMAAYGRQTSLLINASDNPFPNSAKFSESEHFSDLDRATLDVNVERTAVGSQPAAADDFKSCDQ
jgi:hypothetical protein